MSDFHIKLIKLHYHCVVATAPFATLSNHCRVMFLDASYFRFCHLRVYEFHFLCSFAFYFYFTTPIFYLSSPFDTIFNELSKIVVQAGGLWYVISVGRERKNKGIALPGVPISDTELDKLWHKHIRELTKQGIRVTFKPVRFYTTNERDRLGREYYGLSELPTYQDMNSKLPGEL